MLLWCSAPLSCSSASDFLNWTAIAPIKTIECYSLLLSRSKLLPSLGLVNPLHLLFFYTLILSVLSFYVYAMFWCFHLLFFFFLNCCLSRVFFLLCLTSIEYLRVIVHMRVCTHHWIYCLKGAGKRVLSFTCRLLSCMNVGQGQERWGH